MRFKLSLLCLLLAAAVASCDLRADGALEAVMLMYNDSSDASGQPVLSAKALQQLLDFGKNSHNFQFLSQLEHRLVETVWSNVSCRSAQSILNQSDSISNTDQVNGSHELRQLLPELLFDMQNPACYYDEHHGDSSGDGMTWLYTFGAVLVMKIAALSGILAFPCMSAKVYTMTLAFLVPLAISSLMGSTLFIFIPDALNLPEIPHYEENFGNPILKLGAIGIGIYLFYLIEKLLRLVMERKEKQYYSNSGTLSQGSYNLQVAADSAEVKPRRKISTTMAGDITSFPKDAVITKRDSRIDLTASDQSHLKDIAEENKGVPPIAWIAVMGDCIRNFIDGIAIGAAFSLSPLVGLSLTVAFIFEEIPTELGDVAILLNAGISLCRSTMLHFAAAIFAFVGAACGLLLGNLGSSQLWIFAISAGAFLYIALVDLMPEMNHALESDKSKEIGRMKIFLLQNFGLVLGFTITGLLGYYSESLHIDFGGGAGH